MKKQLIKKAFLLGLGATRLTLKKAIEFSKELEKDGIIAKEEVKKFARDLIEKSNKAQKKISKEIDRKINEIIKKKSGKKKNRKKK